MYSKSLLTLARPYAEAVFDFACEYGTLEKWELMLICVKNIAQNPTMMRLLYFANYISSVELSEMFILISQHKLDVFGQNFIRVLSEYKRLFLIPIILDEFLHLRKKKDMLMKMEITTAMPLHDITVSKIISVIKKRFLYKIDVVYKLDRSIIGGIIFRMNNLVIDGSIQGQIKCLKHVLIM